MKAGGFIASLPLWLLYLIPAAIILVAIEVGWRLGNRHRLRPNHSKDVPISAIVGPTLGLLAFLLAFTFGNAASRYDSRKQLVLREASAIDMTYLRADIFPEPQRGEIHNLLREYASLRTGGVTAIITPEIRAKSSALHDRLWAIAAAASAQNPNSVANGLFVQALNDVIDLHAARVMAGRGHIPDTIWLAHYLVMALAMAAMGYQFGLTGQRIWPVTIIMILVFTTVFLLIDDLDRPQEGFLEVSQQPMFDLINKIGAPKP